MSKVPKNCKECKRSKSIDPIQDPLTLNCRMKETQGWLCPKEGIPHWCPKDLDYREEMAFKKGN